MRQKRVLMFAAKAFLALAVGAAVFILLAFFHVDFGRSVNNYLNLFEVIGTVGGLLAIAEIWLIPDYHAVVFFRDDHAKPWLNIDPHYSERKDLVSFLQSECGRLFGSNITDPLAEMPRIPKKYLLKWQLFSSKRGNYWIVPIRIKEDGVKKLEDIREKHSQGGLTLRSAEMWVSTMPQPSFQRIAEPPPMR